MRRSGIAAQLLIALVLLGPSAARAGIARSPRSGWYLPTGAVLAAAFRDDRTSIVVGAETSVARLWAERALWTGVYLDAVWQRTPGVLRLSLGPETGAGIVGADAGYVLEMHGEGVRHGIQVRGVLTLSFVGFYGRFVQLAEGGRFAEVGVLVKLPLTLATWGRPCGPVM